MDENNKNGLNHVFALSLQISVVFLPTIPFASLAGALIIETANISGPYPKPD
jgi:hypothetical protein